MPASSTTSIDLDLLSLMPESAYWEQWDRRADLALQSLLTFHGACDGNVSTTAGVTAASIADAVMEQRLLRIQALKEAKQAAKETEAEEKSTKPARNGGKR